MERKIPFLSHFQVERLKDFPEAQDGILGTENAWYYDATLGEHGKNGFTRDCHLEIT